jgi:ubiquinone/menaquinone biosynthesis C-methylase UbiE
MALLDSFQRFVKRWLSKAIKETDPEIAYDIWASEYDDQPDNLMLALDSALFKEMMDEIYVQGKKVVDIGCGTGRQWPFLLSRSPAELIGFDVSSEMLAKLKDKFPEQKVGKLKGVSLELPDHYCDLIVSTLTIAHIPDAVSALNEWYRILQPGGEICMTDYHPVALVRGGDRTFKKDGKLIAVKNHVHTIQDIVQIAKQLNMEVIRISERVIDEQVKSYYEKQNALSVYDKFKGTPIIYGIHLKKSDDHQ